MAARKAGSNAAGLERTIKALPNLGPNDEALLALARGLANAVDQDPGNAALWREYRAAVGAVMEAGAADDVDDGHQSFLVQIRTPGLRAPMGNPTEP